MDKRLQIQVDNKKVVKNSEGVDVEVLFSMTLPYGVPFALAAEALSELMAEFERMSIEAEAVKKAQESKAEEAKV